MRYYILYNNILYDYLDSNLKFLINNNKLYEIHRKYQMKKIYNRLCKDILFSILFYKICNRKKIEYYNVKLDLIKEINIYYDIFNIKYINVHNYRLTKTLNRYDIYFYYIYNHIYLKKIIKSNYNNLNKFYIYDYKLFIFDLTF